MLRGGVSSVDDGEGPSVLAPGVSSSVPSVSSAVAPPPPTESFLAPSPAVGSSFPPSGPSASSGVKRERDDGDSVVDGEGPVSKKGKGSLSLAKGSSYPLSMGAGSAVLGSGGRLVTGTVSYLQG